MHRFRILLTFCAVVPLVAACGEPPGDSARTPAADAPQPLPDVAAEFVTLSSGEDASAEDWFALAQRAREAADFDTAGEAIELAAKDLAPVRIALEKARIEAAQDNSAGAVVILQSLFEAGFTAVNAITGDAVLGSMAGNAAYDQLVVDMSRQAFPCEHDATFSEFDFWVGNWDVTLASGQVAGSNRIERAERGCVLTENWTGAGGGTGMSINYVDKTTDEWVQVWNSQGGAQIHIRGGLTDEGMRLTGTIHYVANDTTFPFRGLWTPLDDGRVRQYFEQANDDGETWTPWFEGYYTRRASPE